MPQPTEPLAALNAQHAIPEIAQVVETAPGVPAVRIATPDCTAAMHLHGAQITSWKPTGHQEVIFMSSKAAFSEGKAIRGGIPICFPWFRGNAGNPAAPAHGVVRTRNWKLAAIKAERQNVAVTMTIESDEATEKFWPHDFALQLRATFGAALKLELTATNTGKETWRYEEALHTYYQIVNINQAHVAGLANSTYLDNTDDNRSKTQSGNVSIVKATDSAYINNENALDLLDPDLHRRIHIQKENSRTTVIWNPWEAAAEKMSDMGPAQWKEMLCVEGANILENAIELAPNAHHTTTVVMTVNTL